MIGRNNTSSTIRIGPFEFDNVNKFKCLAALIGKGGVNKTEIDTFIHWTFNANKKSLKSKLITKKY